MGVWVGIAIGRGIGEELGAGSKKEGEKRVKFNSNYLMTVATLFHIRI